MNLTLGVPAKEAGRQSQSRPSVSWEDHEAPGSLIRPGPGSLTSCSPSKTRDLPRRFLLILSLWKVLQCQLHQFCSFFPCVIFPCYCNTIHSVSDHKQVRIWILWENCKKKENKLITQSYKFYRQNQILLLLQQGQNPNFFRKNLWWLKGCWQ